MTERVSAGSGNGTIVVTGGAGVVGSRTVQVLRSRGENVVAWDRSVALTGSHQIVDLSNSSIVASAIGRLAAEQPAPYCFVMTHGSHELGTLSDLSEMADSTEMVDSNFSTVVNIVSSAVACNFPPTRFILLGSIAARTPIAFSAMYSASKSAASTFLEAAGYELSLWGHTWCIVDVGGIDTGFNESGHAEGRGPLPVRDAFARVAKRVHSKHGVTPDLVAQRLAALSVARRVRRQHAIGGKARLAGAVSRLGGMRGRHLLVSAALLRRSGIGFRRGI